MTESTENTETVTAVEESQPTTVTDDTAPSSEAVETDDQQDDQQPEDHPARDAAKYRKRAQAAEKERDRLAERLQVLQRAEAQRLATEHLADGADLWRDGAELTALLNDEGDIDPAKVAETAKAVADSHTHWRKRANAAVPASTVTSNGKIWSDHATNTFEDAFRPRSG